MSDDNRGLSLMGATFAERKAAREEAPAEVKQVEADEVEDKAIKPDAATTKKRSSQKR